MTPLVASEPLTTVPISVSLPYNSTYPSVSAFLTPNITGNSQLIPAVTAVAGLAAPARIATVMTTHTMPTTVMPCTTLTTPTATCITSRPIQTQLSTPTFRSLQQSPQLPAVALVANLLNQVIRPELNHPQLHSQSTSKPFTLKLRTSAVRMCQGCRQELKDDLVVSRPERRLIQNTDTGVAFLGKESNSHYHVRLTCIQRVSPHFTGSQMLIPNDVREGLTRQQKVALSSELGITL